MKKKVLLVILVLVCFVSCVAICSQKKPAEIKTNIEDLQIDMNKEVDQEVDTHILEAFELLKMNGSYSNEVWPDYDFNQHSIIVCEREDTTNKIIHAWRLTPTSLDELTNEQLYGMELPAIGVYNRVEFEGVDSIIIGISKGRLAELNEIVHQNFVYEVGIHESYHLYYESYFKLFKLAMEQKFHGGRGTDYPKISEPRVYRKMVYDNLVLAYQNPNEVNIYLGKAKYWHEKWKEEYPKEFYQAKILDIMEGKARYIQTMMVIPVKITDEEKKIYIQNMFDKTDVPSKSLDLESYKLGFVSGVLLDKIDDSWKEKFSKKTMTPVDYLLKDIEMIVDDSNRYEDLLQISQKQMASINELLELKLQDIHQAQETIDIPYLEIKGKYMQGSFETSDFLNENENSYVVDFCGDFENENGKITLKNISIYENEGLFKSTYMIPLMNGYELSNDILKIDTEQIKGEIKVSKTTNKEGRTVFKMK